MGELMSDWILKVNDLKAEKGNNVLSSLWNNWDVGDKPSSSN